VSRATHLGRLVLIALVGGLNLYLVLTTIPGLFVQGPYSDFVWITEAAQRISSGQDPYAGVFRWSPLAAWLLVPLQFVGLWGWRLIEVAVLLALPRKVALLVAISWPFWWDLQLGNLNVIALVLAWWAIRRRPLPFLFLALLVPRPLYLPVLAWVLWKQPAWRRRFAVLVMVNVVFVDLTGWGWEWIAALTRSDFDVTNDWNLSPSHVIGLAWVPVGLALAAVLTWKGRLGLASLAASPYLLPYYFLFGFLALSRDVAIRDRDLGVQVAGGAGLRPGDFQLVVRPDQGTDRPYAGRSERIGRPGVEAG
jgi:hypothetical protein